MYQVRGRGEHDGWLTLLKILLQSVGEFLAVLHKLPLSLLQSVLALVLKIDFRNFKIHLRLLNYHLCPWNVCRHFIDSVKKLLDRAGDLLDCLEECLPVGDLVRDPGQDPLEVGALPVQLLEGLLGPAAAVLEAVLVTHAALQPQHGLVHVDAEVGLVDQPHHQVIREPGMRMLNLNFWIKMNKIL